MNQMVLSALLYGATLTLCFYNASLKIKNYLKKYDGDPLWHGVGVGETMMVVQDHDCANNTACYLDIMNDSS